MVTRKQLAKGVARKARAAARLGERDRTLNRTIQVAARRDVEPHVAVALMKTASRRIDALERGAPVRRKRDIAVAPRNSRARPDLEEGEMPPKPRRGKAGSYRPKHAPLRKLLHVWRCESCFHENDPLDSACARCEEPRALKSPDDWRCSKCQAYVYAVRCECPRCLRKRM